MDNNRRTLGTGIGDEEAVEEKPKGRGCGCWVLLLLVLLGGASATAGLMGMIITREETPLPGEEQIADLGVRYLMIPGEYADMKRPAIKINAETRKNLYLGNCSVCHNADGKGDVPLGRAMYPPAADLTADKVKSKSDGQLYYILVHGINLSGMPAWSDKPEFGGKGAGKDSRLSEDELWGLVQYMRETYHGEKPIP